MSLKLGDYNIRAALNAPYRVAQPIGSALLSRRWIKAAYDSGFFRSFRSALVEGKIIEAYGMDTYDNLIVGSGVVKPHYGTVTFYLNANAALADQAFFIVPKGGMRIKGIQEIHGTAGNDSGTVTMNITRERGAQAPGTGVNVMSATFNAKGTAATVQEATLSDNDAYTELLENDVLSVNFTGTLTSLAGVVVTLSLWPNAYPTAVYCMQANGSLADQAFFVAPRPLKISSIKCKFSVAGTNGSAVSLQVEKCTGTTAPGSGTNLLTNNSDAGFNMKGTPNVVQSGSLSATAADLLLDTGDRLAVDFAGTLTALAGVVVTVAFDPIENEKLINFNLLANGSLADQGFFIADRDYLVRTIAEVHSVAGNDGGSVNLQVEVCKGTTAVGSGTNLLTNNTNAGFDLKGTANTVQYATFGGQHLLYLKKGDRLVLDFAGTLATLAGVVVTALVEPR